jgi:SepF-like predicted cell division protein (DUF552 family)
MLNFIKKIFGSKPAEVKAPYKVETPVAPTLAPTPEEKPAAKAKKPAVKKATTRKPKAPKA